MDQYLLNDHWIFDAGNYLGRTAIGPALLNVDIEHALEPVSSCYRDSAFLGSSWVFGLSNSQRNDHCHYIVAVQRSCMNDGNGSSPAN